MLRWQIEVPVKKNVLCFPAVLFPQGTPTTFEEKADCVL
jgi:hypothetical protein